MKKIVNKNSIFTFLLGGVVFSGITYGINNYQSNTIEYQPTDSSWNVTNVSDAINSLYNMKTELENIKSVGDATAAQILTGKKAIVKGKEITGTMTNESSTSQLGNSFSISESGTIGNSNYLSTGIIKIPVEGYYDTDSTLTFDLTDNNNLYYTNGYNLGYTEGKNKNAGTLTLSVNKNYTHSDGNPPNSNTISATVKLNGKTIISVSNTNSYWNAQSLSGSYELK